MLTLAWPSILATLSIVAPLASVRVANVWREILADAADVGQFLQIGVHLLVAAYGKQHAVRLAVGVASVAVDNLLRLIEQWNVAHVLGLLTCLANPDLAVDVRHQMLGFELLHVHKGQPRQTTETEDVADLRQSRDGDFLVEQHLQLLFLEKLAFDRLEMEVNLGKRILLHPTFGQRNADNLLEVQQVLGGRVVAAPPNRSEVEIIVLDELVRNLIQIAVLLFVGRAQERLGQPQRGFVTDYRSRSEADSRQCPALFVVGAEDLHQRVTVRLLLAQIAVQNDLGGDLFLVEFEVSLNPQNVGGNGVQI